MSLQCLRLSDARPCSMFWRTIGDSSSGLSVTRIIQRLPAHILIERKKFVSRTDTICITFSRIHGLLHSLKVTVKTTTSLSPTVSIFCMPIGPHRTDFWRYYDSNLQIDTTQCQPKNICFASETQVQTILQDAGFTSMPEMGKSPRQKINDLIYLPQ